MLEQSKNGIVGMEKVPDNLFGIERVCNWWVSYEILWCSCRSIVVGTWTWDVYCSWIQERTSPKFCLCVCSIWCSFSYGHQKTGSSDGKALYSVLGLGWVISWVPNFVCLH